MFAQRQHERRLPGAHWTCDQGLFKPERAERHLHTHLSPPPRSQEQEFWIFFVPTRFSRVVIFSPFPPLQKVSAKYRESDAGVRGCCQGVLSLPTSDAHGEGALVVVAGDTRATRFVRTRVGNGVVAVRLEPEGCGVTGQKESTSGEMHWAWLGFFFFSFCAR